MDSALAVVLASTVGVLVGFVAGTLTRNRRPRGLARDRDRFDRLTRYVETELRAL